MNFAEILCYEGSAGFYQRKEKEKKEGLKALKACVDVPQIRRGQVFWYCLASSTMDWQSMKLSFAPFPLSEPN